MDRFQVYDSVKQNEKTANDKEQSHNTNLTSSTRLPTSMGEDDQELSQK